LQVRLVGRLVLVPKEVYWDSLLLQILNEVLVKGLKASNSTADEMVPFFFECFIDLLLALKAHAAGIGQKKT
jgi:hypothetical protein